MFRTLRQGAKRWAGGTKVSELRDFDVAETAPNLVFVADRTGRVVHVNSHWVAYTGRTLEGLESLPHGTPSGVIHPDDVEVAWERWNRSLETGENFEMQYRLRGAEDGRYRWFLTRAAPMRDSGGEITHWAGVATDIHDQVRSGEGSRFLSEVANVLASSLDHEQLVAAFARVAVQRFSDGCAVLFADRGDLRIGAVAHKDPALMALLGKRGIERFLQDGLVEGVVATREPLHGPSVDPELGSRASIVVPMIVAQHLIGTLSFIATDESGEFDAADVDIAMAAARQLAIALENVRSFERLRLLARVTDILFGSGEAKAKLRKVLDVIVEDVADWAAIYVLGASNTIRLEELAHRNPQIGAVLAEMRGQRIFNHASERSFYETLNKHRTMLRTDAGIVRLRETLQPYILPFFAQATPQSMLTVPLFTTDAVYGALTIYSTTRNFGDHEVQLMEEVARRVALAFEHEESLERERRLTKTLQEVTLPAQLPNVPGAEVSTVYIAATASDAQVGGDWYDIFELPNGSFLFSMGDVTGRGLQASAIMGKLRHTINVVGMYEKDPGKILDAAERVVVQRYPDAIATAFVVIYDPHARAIVGANAGHPYPLLRLFDGSIEPLSVDGMPIGLRSLAPSQPSRSRVVHDVAAITFYTDGVVEASRDITAGEETLIRALGTGAIPFVRSPATLIASTCLPAQVQDDAAIFVVAFPHTTWRFHADHARAATDARRSFVDHLRAEAGESSEIDGAEVIFGELVANVVRHAPGPIDIALEWIDGFAVLHVTDRGNGFKFESRRRADVLMESGRGLWLVEQFGGSVDVERIEGYGTHVRVTLPVERAAETALERSHALA
ncbi:MAG: SpoIIE family protein phosphatase [Vulcanimicrobiaceae bacterium]